MIIVIEKLSISSLISLFVKIRKLQVNNKKRDYYYLFIDKYMIYVKKFLEMLFSFKFTLFNFTFESVEENNGMNTGLYILKNDLQNFFNSIDLDPLLEGKFDSEINHHCFKAIIQKRITLETLTKNDLSNIRDTILLIKAINYHLVKDGSDNQNYLLLDKKPWMNEFQKIGKSLKIDLIPNYFSYYDQIIISMKSIRIITVLKRKIKKVLYQKIACSKNRSKETTLVIDSVIQIFRPKMFFCSDFLQPEKIKFVSKDNPINKKDLVEIKECGMDFISLDPKISPGMSVPVFISDTGKTLQKKTSSLEQKIVSKYRQDYIDEKKEWDETFEKLNAKIYLTSNKWSTQSISASSAMLERGGISGVFQTSFYENPVSYALICADLFFSFSQKAPAIEIQQGSRINYNICVGNLSQSRNKFLKEDAKALRKQLQNNGAEKIISYFDHVYAEDHRWGTGYYVARENYQFLLSKLLENKWLGLVIKPKKPKYIRKVLGNVSSLLNQALATGRCYIFENHDSNSPKNFENPPAQSAMASDVSIQEMIEVGTAGVEAALTGTPTLMLDRSRDSKSQFYKLGEGKVVFNDFQTLWKRLQEHWLQGPIDGFGDWSPIIDDIDPFRDGKAAERLTTFLHWLDDGFSNGLGKDQNLEAAVSKYADDWGMDKVFKYPYSNTF